MRNLDYIFIIILTLIILYILYNCNNKTKETFANITDEQLGVLQNLSPHLIAIKNLSDLATKLMSGSLTVPGNLRIAGNLIVDQTSTLSGATTVNSTLNAVGAIATAGALSVATNIGVGGILDVVGGTTLKGSLNVAGASTLTGGIPNLAVGSNLSVGNALTVVGATILNGETNIKSNLNVVGDITVGTIFFANRDPTRDPRNATTELIKVFNMGQQLFLRDMRNPDAPRGINFYGLNTNNPGMWVFNQWGNKSIAV